MTNPDLAFIRTLIRKGRIGDPVLELGGGYGGKTCRGIIKASGRRYAASDCHPAPGVDFIADFETAAGIDRLAAAGPFGTVLVLNVLEHTFDPIAVLDNARRVVAPGGAVVTITPAVWPIHNYPLDCCRLLPDWHRRYAASRSISLDQETFSYIGFGPVASFRSRFGQDRFPPPVSGRPIYFRYSRLVHDIFFTFGRGMAQPGRVAIGAVFIALPS